MKAVGDGATSLARAASAQFSCHGDAAPALAAIKVKRPQRGSNFQIIFFLMPAFLIVPASCNLSPWQQPAERRFNKLRPIVGALHFFSPTAQEPGGPI